MVRLPAGSSWLGSKHQLTNSGVQRNQCMLMSPAKKIKGDTLDVRPFELLDDVLYVRAH